MSAELLRRAAKEMRVLAELADTGPWEVNDDGDLQTAYEPTEGYGPHVLAPTMHRPTARHIASWHPAIALGIASLFEELASELERVRPCEKDCANCSDMRWSWPTAELVAKDYLGEDAS